MEREFGFRLALQDYIRREANPVDKFSHQARLYQLAIVLGKGNVFDDEILFAAAWLHDLGVFIGHRPSAPEKLARWDNVAYAVRMAPEILTKVGFPESKIPAVCDVITTHLPSGNPTVFEGKLLRDADILEQLGAVGILRTVSKVGRDSRFPRFDQALKVLRHNLDQLPGMLLLETSRQQAIPRIAALETFLENADVDALGLDW